MKYVGGKTRMAQYIAPLINGLISEYEIKKYIEPFVGGANIVEHIICDSIEASDANEYLIALYQGVQEGRELPDRIPQELYEDIKNNKEKYDKFIVGAAGLLAAFSAVWFGGHADRIANDGRNYFEDHKRLLMKQSQALKNIKFEHHDYTYYSDRKNCLIYCDPPYADKDLYLGGFDSKAFWDWVWETSKNNIVLVSEYIAPRRFTEILSVDIDNLMDRNSGDRRKVSERVFTCNENVIDYMSKELII